MEAKQERVLEGSKTECEECVSPESHCNTRHGPRTVWMVLRVSLNNILLCTRDDGRYREEEWTQEKALALMGNGGLE